MLKLRLKLDEIIKEQNISQNKLAQIIEVRQATLSDMCRNARTEINIPIIEKIANHFGIKDISNLIELVDIKEENQ
ncbi:plasmid maintenance system antidote protein VapI [Paenibacillus endophyticus]|uniref:Plasmid maintenance system antidote protein VapI n=1 Tax=Paenibacillus endophyticus TaxID=1294268 RepID=A0A7W5GC59_9BACL|nr:helix-turn-helix transcriptional regulator [Paenibacillus endophyticus]MBB3154495.1 plasmid maintenance system antidote protein VapI [Paenibacillus endophyticus]